MEVIDKISVVLIIRARMRLSNDQVRVIRKAILECDPDAEILLFGSRVDDAAKGGDIDVLCLSEKIDRKNRRLIRRKMSDRLEGQRVDLVVAADQSKPFVRMAMEDAVRLTEPYD